MSSLKERGVFQKFRPRKPRGFKFWPLKVAFLEQFSRVKKYEHDNPQLFIRTFTKLQLF